jgi:protein SCO1/2
MEVKWWGITDRGEIIRPDCPIRFSCLLTIIIFLALSGTSPVYSQGGESHHSSDSALDEAAALKVSQSALGNKTGDHHFTSSDGEDTNLAQFLGKPLLVSFIYTSCYHTCPILTKHLADVVSIARDALGDDSFSVISIGFDTAVDSPERMRIFASERGIDMPIWSFLSTDQATIDALSNELGFIYFRSPKGFDHLAQITLLDAEGRVYRQIYDENFEPPVLVEPLKDLVFGRHTETSLVTGWINNIRLFCTIYDPTRQRYRFDYSIFIALGISIITLGATAVFVVRSWRQHKSTA